MKTGVKRLLTEYNIVLILIVILLYGFLGVPYFSGTNNLIKLASDLSMYGIVSIGMTFLLISGEIDLSLGMSVALSIPTVISLLIALAFEGFSYLFTAIATVAAALNTYYAVALGLRCKRLYLS